jgi:hypothetical protein
LATLKARNDYQSIIIHGVVQSPMIPLVQMLFLCGSNAFFPCTFTKEEVRKTIDTPPFALMGPMEFQTLGILFSLAKWYVLERPITKYSLFFFPPPLL